MFLVVSSCRVYVLGKASCPHIPFFCGIRILIVWLLMLDTCLFFQVYPSPVAPSVGPGCLGASTLSPRASHTAVRVLLRLATSRGRHLQQRDSARRTSSIIVGIEKYVMPFAIKLPSYSICYRPSYKLLCCYCCTCQVLRTLQSYDTCQYTI